MDLLSRRAEGSAAPYSADAAAGRFRRESAGAAACRAAGTGRTATAPSTRTAAARPTRTAAARPTRTAAARPTRTAAARPTRTAAARPTRTAQRARRGQPQPADADSPSALMGRRTVWRSGWLTGLQCRDGWRIGAPSRPRQPTYARPDVHTSVRQGRRGKLGTLVPAGPGRPTAAVRAPRENRRAVAYRPESQAQPSGPEHAREDRTRFGAQQEAKAHLMDSQLAWRDLAAKRLRACHEIPPALSLR